MILLWLLLAIVAGAAIGRLAGFMAGEFIMRPALLIARGVAYLLGAVAGWARRLP